MAKFKKTYLVMLGYLFFIGGIMAYKIGPMILKSFENNEKTQVEALEHQQAFEAYEAMENKTAAQMKKMEYHKHWAEFHNRMYAQSSSTNYFVLIMGTTIIVGLSVLFITLGKTKKSVLSEKQATHIHDFSDYTGDVIGQQISWSPLSSGGANFMSTRLQQVNPNLVKITNTTAIKIMPWMFALVGIAKLFFDYYSLYLQGVLWDLSFFDLLSHISMFSVMFIGVSIFVYLMTSTNVVFDKNRQLFAGTTSIAFQDIYAIQLLSKFVSSKSGGYTNYELNLILNQGERVHVMNNYHADVAKSDAILLGKFLRVPVWKDAL